jgi:hypothetical protein
LVCTMSSNVRNDIFKVRQNIFCWNFCQIVM